MQKSFSGTFLSDIQVQLTSKQNNKIHKYEIKTVTTLNMNIFAMLKTVDPFIKISVGSAD